MQTPLPRNSSPDVTAAFGVQLKAPDDTPETLDKIAAAGFRVVRRGFIWEAVEREKGVYDFSKYDALVDAYGARGLGIIGCIAFGNRLYPPVREPEGRRAWAAFAAALAARYAGRGILWELWNEPNVCTFWGRHGTHNSHQYADEYLALVRETIPAMRAADPGCRIAVGAVSGCWSASYEWMAYIFRKGLLATGADVLSVHPYSTYVPEDYAGAYARIRGMMALAGAPAGFPMVDSERGYPIGRPTGNNPDELLSEMGFRPDDGTGRSEAAARQAALLVRQYLVDAWLGVGPTSWYEWAGDEGFGLVLPSGVETPALGAFRFLVRELRGFRLDTRIDIGHERAFCLRFRRGPGEEKLVLWCAPPEGGKESTNAPREAPLPCPPESIADAVGLLGEPLPIPTGPTIQITGFPVYLRLKEPNP